MRWTMFPTWFSSAVLCALLLLLSSVSCAQAPEPGPGPVPPSTQRELPPVEAPPHEQPTEVPIGRLPDYEENKRKAQETIGQPPGAMQEDPAVHRKGPAPKPEQ